MKGIYLLIIDISKDISAKIGALGIMKFEKGFYAYVGSAQNFLEKRVSRHLSKKKKKHWHIDYLLNNKNTKILKIVCKEAGKSEECRLAKKLNMLGTAIPKFGCSDCNCYSHFFKVQPNHLNNFLSSKQLKKVNDLQF